MWGWSSCKAWALCPAWSPKVSQAAPKPRAACNTVQRTEARAVASIPCRLGAGGCSAAPQHRPSAYRQGLSFFYGTRRFVALVEPGRNSQLQDPNPRTGNPRSARGSLSLGARWNSGEIPVKLWCIPGFHIYIYIYIHIHIHLSRAFFFHTPRQQRKSCSKEVRMCIYIYIYMFICIYIYIYIYRERDIDIRFLMSWIDVTQKCFDAKTGQEGPYVSYELRGSQGMGVASNSWFDRVLLSVLYMIQTLMLTIYSEDSDSEGKHLFHRVGWKGRIWQACANNNY